MINLYTGALIRTTRWYPTGIIVRDEKAKARVQKSIGKIGLIMCALIASVGYNADLLIKDHL